MIEEKIMKEEEERKKREEEEKERAREILREEIKKYNEIMFEMLQEIWENRREIKILKSIVLKKFDVEEIQDTAELIKRFTWGEIQYLRKEVFHYY